MSNINELKEEDLKEVTGGFDHQIMNDCEANLNATKNLVNAYELVLAEDRNYVTIKNLFNDIVNKYEHGKYYEAYNDVINLKNSFRMYRGRGNENFSKFISEFENNILAIDFLLRQFCTNMKPFD